MGKSSVFKKMKASKKFHPKSRKAKKYGKELVREERLGRRYASHSRKLRCITTKLSWFRNELEGCKSCSPRMLLELIDRYFHRFDDELEQIDIENTIVKERKGLAHASREASIRITLEDERRDYESSGFELPNFLSKDVIENILEWDGSTMRKLPSFKMVMMKRCNLEHLAKGDNRSTKDSKIDFDKVKSEEFGDYITDNDDEIETDEEDEEETEEEDEGSDMDT